MTGFNQVDNRVLYNLRVHLKRRDMRVLAQLTKHGVGYVAYTRLYRQERRRNPSGFQFGLKERGYVSADLRGRLIHRSESGNLVRTVGLHYSGNLLRVNLDMVATATV